MWSNLINEFISTDTDDRYELKKESKQYCVKNPRGNLTSCLNQLDENNSSFENVGNMKILNAKDDLKLHIIMNLPENVYSELITAFKVYSTLSLCQVKKIGNYVIEGSRD